MTEKIKEKIQELLAVPKMPEEEQVDWVETHCEMEGYESNESNDELNIWVVTESLADLAFRLRDEVELEFWERAAWIVEALLVFPDEKIEWILKHAENRYHDPEMTASFLQQKGKPVHWIIAALIAKELSKDD